MSDDEKDLEAKEPTPSEVSAERRKLKNARRRWKTRFTVKDWSIEIRQRRERLGLKKLSPKALAEKLHAYRRAKELQ